MTLFVMPSLYAIMTDFSNLFRRSSEERVSNVSDKMLGAAVPADD